MTPEKAGGRFSTRPLCFVTSNSVTGAGGFLNNPQSPKLATLSQDEVATLPEGAAEFFSQGLSAYNSGSFSEAVQCFERALSLAGSVPVVHLELGKSLFYLGEVDLAVDHLRRAAEASDPELRRRALGAIACIVPGSPRANNASIFEDRRAWAEVEAARESPSGQSSQRPVAVGGKLCIGYLSKFFHARNWMKPVWGVINNHNRAAFDIHLFSDGLPPCAESGYQAKPLDHVHDVRGMSNTDLACLVARTGIDILVDLNGYSFQPRLGLFMRRPAPVQVGWFNMYATSGIDAFDYIVGDATVIPDSEEAFCCERVLRVPGTYLAYSVPYSVPDVSPLPCLTTGHITFASLCSQYKLTNEVIETWAAILQQAPGAQLLIKNAGLGDRTNRAALEERMARWGMPSDRVLLEGPAPHQEFLATYERADIALDTFPYNGGTTTMEALWQGVPVLTFNGDRWASRQSRSLLLAAGLDEWCLPDRETYVARAVELVQSPTTPANLASLRAGMRQRLARSPACDSAGLCRALELIYREVPRKRRGRAFSTLSNSAAI